MSSDAVPNSLRITTWNVASLRAAWDHGLPTYIRMSQPDIFCIQETKMHSDSSPKLETFKLPGYFGYFYHAEKRGYSGTAIYTKIKPISIKPSFKDIDGRSITIEFDKFYLVNTYVVNAGDNLQRLDYKLNTFIPKLEKHLQKLKESKKVIWTGDINVAHNEIDIYSSDGFDTTAGYTPEERNWFDGFLKSGYVDIFRRMHPKAREYTFFSHLGQGRLANKGWRIDYFLMNTEAYNQGGVIDCVIEGGVDGSDHVPVSLYLDRSQFLTKKDTMMNKTGVKSINETNTIDSFFKVSAK